jgi:uncharacterized protein YecT (DUF1311 family)
MMSWLRVIGALAFAAWLCGAGPAAAADPSFDCQKATQPADLAICRGNGLSRQDTRMAQAYAEALSAFPARRAALVAEQRDWLASRNCAPIDPDNPSDDFIACVSDLYEARIYALETLIGSARTRAIQQRLNFSEVMRPGRILRVDDVEIRCDRAALTVRFGEAGGYNSLVGRGWLDASWVECPVGGRVVRFKVGGQYPAMAYGLCGAARSRVFSVWVDRRKQVSKREAGNACLGWRLHSLVVSRTGVRLCEGLGGPVTDAPPKKGACVFRRTDLSKPVDTGTFTNLPPDVRIAGRSTELGALCGRLVDPKEPWRVAVPQDLKQPAWTEVIKGREDADFSGVGFNATSLAASAGARTARFDLFNEGRIRTIYAADDESHWFDGTAFAVDRPGVLRTPFDAHDWERSIRSGIYPFVYDHATVFFAKGRTYLLLDPALRTADAKVVRISASGGVREICVLKARPESF